MKCECVGPICRHCQKEMLPDDVRECTAVVVSMAPCVHLGEVVDTVEVACCGGRTRAKVYACSEHGRCTIEIQAEATACCPCDRYLPVSRP